MGASRRCKVARRVARKVLDSASLADEATNLPRVRTPDTRHSGLDGEPQKIAKTITKQWRGAPEAMEWNNRQM